MRFVVLFFLVVVVVVVFVFSSQGPTGTPTTGSTAGFESAYDQRWADVELMDVLTGKTFRLAGFKGKTVFVELMAIWCPLCTEQQSELQKLKKQVGDKVVFVSVDIDPNERAADLERYARRLGFDWLWAVDPDGLFNSFFRKSPPETPVVVINPDGSFRIFSGRITKASEFLSYLQSIGAAS